MTPGDTFLAVLSSSQQFPIHGDTGVFSIVDATIRNAISPREEKWDYWGWLHGMEELGYLYVDWSRKKVLVEPPALAGSTLSPNKFLLVGARTNDYLLHVTEQAKKNGLTFIQKDLPPEFPQRLMLTGPRKGVESLAGELGIAISTVPIAYQLASITPPVSPTIQEYRFNDIILDHDYVHGKESPVVFFNPRTLRYDGRKPTEAGQYVLGIRKRYGNHFNLYRRKENNREQVCVDVPPREAKWFCLVGSGARLMYYKHRNAVLIPRYCHLPIGLSRALALCAGEPAMQVSRLPSLPRDGSFQFKNSVELVQYRQVPEIIAHVVANKLGTSIQLVEYPEDRLACKTR